VSRGRLCPKGSASLQLTTGDARQYQACGTGGRSARTGKIWDLDTAMDMIADRVIAGRRDGWQWEVDGARTRRTLGFASLGGATLDNEENYLIKKLFTGAGRDPDRESGPYIDTPRPSPVWGPASAAAGATNFPRDLVNSDCILSEGSNMAECHPVAFQWVMEAKARGATLIHVDPRFTRTSAVADLYLPIRAGADIAFVAGLINYVLSSGRYFKDYVLPTRTRPRS